MESRYLVPSATDGIVRRARTDATRVPVPMAGAARYFSQLKGFREFMTAGRYAAVLDELACQLEAKGYSVGTIVGYLRGARHVTYALEVGELSGSRLTEPHLREFARQHRAKCRCPSLRDMGAGFYSCIHHLVPVLQRMGIAAQPVEREPFQEELVAFEHHLEDVQGVTPESRETIVRNVRSVLKMAIGKKPSDPKLLSLARIQAYVLEVAPKYSPATLNGHVSSIRAFVRFLKLQGVEVESLAELRTAHLGKPLWSEKALTLAQLRMLVAPLRRADSTGRRDLAVVLLLAYLGLRREDVARLKLRDFNPRQRTLVIRRPKPRCGEVLPVPEEARDAVLEYVRLGRPSTTCDALFLTRHYPYDAPISAKAVTKLVEKAFLRSGVQSKSKGAHVLRHTFATQLVAQRHPIKVVADLMRHRSIDTTVRYVRIDIERLRGCVSAWPLRS